MYPVQVAWRVYSYSRVQVGPISGKPFRMYSCTKYEYPISDVATFWGPGPRGLLLMTCSNIRTNACFTNPNLHRQISDGFTPLSLSLSLSHCSGQARPVCFLTYISNRVDANFLYPSFDRSTTWYSTELFFNKWVARWDGWAWQPAMFSEPLTTYQDWPTFCKSPFYEYAPCLPNRYNLRITCTTGPCTNRRQPT